MTQREKAELLHQLHHGGELLVLPNIWDPLGALLLESLGYRAIATASAAIAYSNGYDDGEKVPFQDLLIKLKSIVSAVNIPVSADIEKGYAVTDGELTVNIRRLIETGIVGINIEDTDSQAKQLNPVEVQCKRISAIRKVGEEMGVPLFINARTDVFLHGKQFSTAEEKMEELLKRGAAYKEAGANCFFPILVKNQSDIETIVSTLKIPVNILAIPGIPGLAILNEIGVARISLGPGFLKIAVKAMKDLAVQLKELKGLSAILENEITSDHIKALVNK